MLYVHLAVGVGFYHHLILKLQLEYDLDLVGTIDFVFTQNVTGLLNVNLFENICIMLITQYIYDIFKHLNIFFCTLRQKVKPINRNIILKK